MFNISRLVPRIKLSIFMMLVAGSTSAYAEYYVVYPAPSAYVVACDCDVYQKVTTYHHRHHYRHHVHHHKHHYVTAYHHKRSRLNMTVYYPGQNIHEVIYTESNQYTEDNFDLDRRTADDVGSDMNIDN